MGALYGRPAGEGERRRGLALTVTSHYIRTVLTPTRTTDYEQLYLLRTTHHALLPTYQHALLTSTPSRLRARWSTPPPRPRPSRRAPTRAPSSSRRALHTERSESA